jgi:hypothetical protein
MLEQSRAANALWFPSLMHAEGAVALALAISMYCIACGRKRRGEERRTEGIDGWMIDGHTGQARMVKDVRVFKTIDR